MPKTALDWLAELATLIAWNVDLLTGPPLRAAWWEWVPVALVIGGAARRPPPCAAMASVTAGELLRRSARRGAGGLEAVSKQSITPYSRCLLEIVEGAYGRHPSDPAWLHDDDDGARSGAARARRRFDMTDPARNLTAEHTRADRLRHAAPTWPGNAGRGATRL